MNDRSARNDVPVSGLKENMAGFWQYQNPDRVLPVVPVAIVLSAVVLIAAAALSVGFCEDDCDAHCGSNCDCLSCLPALLMIVVSSQDFDHLDQPVSWRVAATQCRPDPARVTGIEHPPQLSV